MTIDEAIIHCEEVAIRQLKNENNAKCVQCGEEHVQLAKWLKELKDYKSREDVAPVRHGYWIRHDDADIVEGYYVPEYECSKCGTWKKDDSDFCPDCGAKMDGGES